MSRVFLIVVDSFGIGEMPDSYKYGDEGSNTLKSLYNSGELFVPNLKKMGLFNIDGMDFGEKENDPSACFARNTEKSNAKDTTAGHWEMMCLVTEKPFPTYPEGFPNEILQEFERQTGRKVLCNKPYSGTQVILDYGSQHEKTGDLIVYTSGDSVFQIAANEEMVPLEELYEICRKARKILTGEHSVGRVIARPFIGKYPNYTRTTNRHDFSVEPTGVTALDILKENGFDVVSVGKINDIFASKGITLAVPSGLNEIGMKKTEELLSKDFNGLCFTNLVDFDALYGHRNDVKGYTEALNVFDKWLGNFMSKLRDDDILIVTGDHGCDPATQSTDHSREYTPLLVYSKKIKPHSLGTRGSFCDIGKTILDIFRIENTLPGDSFFKELKGI